MSSSSADAAALRPILNPKSIAVIGASKKPGSIGQTVIQNLLDSKYDGGIYPINPTASDILGVPCFKSITDVPLDSIDVVVYTVPEKLVVQCAKEAASKKVKGHIVITSGFSEVGNKEPEEELVRIAHQSGGRVLGPNIVGALLNTIHANASFAPCLPYSGKTALISQSGALIIALDTASFVRRFGCSSMISLGNMADVDFSDCISYYSSDPATSCIALYVEGVKKGRKFLEAGRKAGKPIIALKSGVSAHGAAAAASHTGSLAGSAKIYEAAFKQGKVIQARDLDELLDSAQALSMQPTMPGPNVVVITNGGGIGVLSSDSAEEYGIPLKSCPKDLQDAFYKCMPEFGSPKNPVDITGGSGFKGYEDCIEIALKHDWCHGVAVLYCETAVTVPDQIADAIARGIAKVPGNKKPIVACFVGGEKCKEAGRKLNGFNVPMYDNPRKTMRALSALRQAELFRTRPDDTFHPHANTNKEAALELIKTVRASGRTAFTEPEAHKLFECYGLPTAKFKTAKTADEAVAAAASIGYPVVMKIVSPDILHKSDAGGVKVNLKDEAAIRAAFEAILENAKKYKATADIHGVLIQEMAPQGWKEVIVGTVNDATFGPTVMFGMGGIFVEVLKDVTFRIAPFTKQTAMEMFPDIKSYPILAGTRGEKPRDQVALSDVVSRISQMCFDLGDEIAESDANPVMVFEEGKGVRVVDARIILKKK